MSKDKYDRQTRLWGEGQYLISAAKVVCFGSDMCATEIIKNLVLSGIGEITIVDNAIVSERDLKENFFILKTDLGKPRSEVVHLALKELNNDVKVDFINSLIESFIGNKGVSIASSYDVIISTNNTAKFNHECCEIADKFAKRLIIVNNFGLINYIKLYENYHGNMQLRLLENPVKDIRVANPFKELKDFCVTIDLDSLTEIEHKHIPYIVILVKALVIFQQKHNGSNPKSKEEKEEFKAIITEMKKYPEEDNFKEALANYYFCNHDKLDLFNEKLNQIRDTIQEMQLPELINRSNDIMGLFFIICESLLMFYQQHQTLPVVGNIPDMISDTITYINLKKVYAAKAKADRDIITSILKQKIASLESTTGIHDKLNQIKMRLNDSEINFIDIVCKNWPQISLFKYPHCKDEAIGKWLLTGEFDEEYQMLNLGWYILAKATEKFNEKHQRYPGECNNFKEDIPLLKEYYEGLVNDLKEFIPFDISSIVNDDHIFEMCRFGRGKVAPCVSIIGSMASQEIIKMITYQFETVNNTIVYDGTHVMLSTFKI